MSGSATLVAVLAVIYFSSGVYASMIRVSASWGTDQQIAIGYLVVFVIGALSSIVAMFGQKFVYRRMVPLFLVLLIPVWIGPGGHGMINSAMLSAPVYMMIPNLPFYLVLGVDFAPLLVFVLVLLTSIETLAPEELGGGLF